jgi:thiamine-monophosphate kinase
MRGEFDFIANLKARAAAHYASTPELVLGIGDDALLWRERTGRDSVITTDLLIEDIDFRRTWMPPALLGHKSLAVSLSDIAAMGATPRLCLISIGVPHDVWNSNFVEEFYDSLLALAAEHNVALGGGDISRTSDRIVVNSTVLGQMTRDHAVLRSGAQPGDRIFVTGHLGGAAAGLHLLESGARLTTHAHTNPTRHDKLILRQLRPQPRLAWSDTLVAQRLPTSLIDLSDGLSSDLAHLCHASEVGALIHSSQIPVDPDIGNIGARDALNQALHGGEDYELLFTVNPRHAARVGQEFGGIPITEIGEITHATDGIRLTIGDGMQPLEAHGFKHF